MFNLSDTIGLAIQFSSMRFKKRKSFEKIIFKRGNQAS